MANRITSNRLSAAPQFSPAPQILNYGPVRELIEQDGYKAGLECDMEDSFPVFDAYALVVEEPWPGAESLALTGNRLPLVGIGRNPARRNRLVRQTPMDAYLEIAPPPRRSRMMNNVLKCDGRSRQSWLR